MPAQVADAVETLNLEEPLTAVVRYCVLAAGMPASRSVSSARCSPSSRSRQRSLTGPSSSSLNFTMTCQVHRALTAKVRTLAARPQLTIQVSHRRRLRQRQPGIFLGLLSLRDWIGGGGRRENEPSQHRLAVDSRPHHGLCPINARKAWVSAQVGEPLRKTKFNTMASSVRPAEISLGARCRTTTMASRRCARG